jgi:hypothetical protein
MRKQKRLKVIEKQERIIEKIIIMEKLISIDKKSLNNE